jgi:hypothetical protein
MTEDERKVTDTLDELYARNLSETLSATFTRWMEANGDKLRSPSPAMVGLSYFTAESLATLVSLCELREGEALAALGLWCDTVNTRAGACLAFLQQAEDEPDE